MRVHPPDDDISRATAMHSPAHSRFSGHSSALRQIRGIWEFCSRRGERRSRRRIASCTVALNVERLDVVVLLSANPLAALAPDQIEFTPQLTMTPQATSLASAPYSPA